MRIRRDLIAAVSFFAASTALLACGPTVSRLDSALVSDRDWPCFLGPHGTGATADGGIVGQWGPAGPPVTWSKRIGTGYSAPSVLHGRLVVHHRLRNNEIVECLHAASGGSIWKYEYSSNFADPYGYNNGPRCTPLLSGTRCYTFGAEGKLMCLDLQTGKPLWSRDTQKDFDVPNHFFGVGCTPILEGNLLIVMVGGQPESGVVAFNADTGKTVWRSVGKSTWQGVATDWPTEPNYRWTGNEMVVSYSSPLAVTIHGRRQVLCLTRQGLVSIDPPDGKVNFRYWFCSRDYESVNAARPVVVGDKILLSAAYNVGAALLQVDPSGRSVTQVWRDRRNLLAHWSTPIEVDGYVYGFSGRHEPEGELRCVELLTGRIVWKTKGYDGDTDAFSLDPSTNELTDRKSGKVVPFPFFGRGSLTKIGTKFLILGERGTLALAQLSPQGYKELARASFPGLKYPVWPSPVVADRRVYLRDEGTLLCIDLAAKR